MSDVVRTSGSIVATVLADTAGLESQMVSVKKKLENPDFIKIRPTMSFDDKLVARETNKIVRAMQTEAARMTARTNLFGEAGNIGARPGGFGDGWKQVIAGGIGLNVGLSAAQRVAGTLRAFGNEDRAERGLGVIGAASSMPVVGHVVGFADSLVGATKAIENFRNATNELAAAKATANDVGFAAAAARANRRGDTIGATQYGSQGRQQQIGDAWYDLDKQFKSTGTSMEFGADGLRHAKINETGKRLKKAMDALAGAVADIADDTEDAIKDIKRREGAGVRAAGGGAMADFIGNRAGGGFTASQRASSINAAARASQASTAADRLGKAESFLDVLKAGFANAADADKVAIESGERTTEAARSDAYAGKAAMDRMQAQRRADAESVIGSQRKAALVAHANKVATLRAQGKHQEADRLEAQSPLVGASFPLADTVLAGSQAAGAIDALNITQARQRGNISAAFGLRQSITGASGRGYDELAGVLGLIGSQRQEWMNPTDTINPDELKATQLSELVSLRQRISRPRSYSQAGDALSEAAGGPGGDKGDQMVRLLASIDAGIDDLKRKPSGVWQ